MQEAYEEQPVAAAEHEDSGASVMGFQGEMVILTWAAFIVAAVVLKYVLWNPVIRGLEKRETEIKDSLDGADKARREISESENKATEIVEKAKVDAREESAAVIALAHERASQYESDFRDDLRKKQELAEKRLDEERDRTIQILQEQAGGEVGAALERILPGLLTEEQKAAYLAKIVDDIQFAK